MKKKVIKIIGIILLIIIIIFLVHTIRNYIIISDLQNKIATYSNSTNFYTKYVTTEDSGIIVTMEYYKKGDKEVTFLERNSNGEISKMSMYNNGERKDIFWDNKENKTAQLNTESIVTVNIYNFIETDNIWQKIIGSICSNIKSGNCDGKQCYIIKGFLSPNALITEDQEIYIDKDTGLYVKTIENGKESKREYEFDNVDDSIFVEPDIGEYKLN